MIQKIIRYFLLLIFATYLTHGFIPHHHHDQQLVLSCDISFNKQAGHICQIHSGHSGKQLDSFCPICDQIAKEYHNQGYFFKEPIVNLDFILPDNYSVYYQLDYKKLNPIFHDYSLWDKKLVNGNGLRAPPLV